MDPASLGDLRILFIPSADVGPTSERTPTMLRMMRERYSVVALPARWDRYLYDPRRARGARFVLYALDKVVLTLRGLWLARRFGAKLVFCETAHHAIAGLGIARILGIRCAWDSHGNGKLFHESLGKGRWSVRLVTALEQFLGQRVDDLITVSEVDAEAYAGLGLPPAKIHVIPLCVSLQEIDSAAAPPDVQGRESRPPVLLFFGSFAYEPNREALRFINDQLAPHLDAHGVQCEIRIAGRDIPEMDFHPSIRVLGFVPDIYECIREADVCIVPVRRGVGVLTKVIDSMAVGTPLVLSAFAARGIPEVRHGVHAYVAATDAEFLRWVTEALSDPVPGRAMSLRARSLVEQRFDWRAQRARLDAILRGPPVQAAGDTHGR